MAATSYSPLPTSTHAGYGSNQNPYPTSSYDAGVGSLASHPYQYETSSYGNNFVDNQQPSSNNYLHSSTLANDQPMDHHNQQNSYANKTKQHTKVPLENQSHESESYLVRSEHQISNRPPKDQHHYQSQSLDQSKMNRSRQPMQNPRGVSNGAKNNMSDAGMKTSSFLQELKPTKSSKMREAAIKQKEENLARKRNDKFFPSSENKSKNNHAKSQYGYSKTDDERSDAEKIKRSKKQSHSVPKTGKKGTMDDDYEKYARTNHSKEHPKQHKSRRDGHKADDSKSSGDDDPHKRHRSKSLKRATGSDSHLGKHGVLPPIHRSRVPPYYDPRMDYPLLPGHPLRGRMPPYEMYPPYAAPYYDRRYLHDHPEDAPPYIPGHHDLYDPFFDYQKRKSKQKQKRSQSKSEHHSDIEDRNGHETDRDDGAKSQHSRKSRHKNTSHDNHGRKSRHNHEENLHPPWAPAYYPQQYYNNRDMLEVWRQERNEYLKKKFKPSVHDVLYSQQFMKSDSYLENQRRRVLRDVQGYYFPYKKYTLKDYKDLQKVNNQNPFAEVNETVIDRKERAKKRQEYGSLVERQLADNPIARPVQPRDISLREPWHLSQGDLTDPERMLKRERALEYAREQVRYIPADSIKDHSHSVEPDERHGKQQQQPPKPNHHNDGSNNARRGRPSHLYDEYEQ